MKKLLQSAALAFTLLAAAAAHATTFNFSYTFSDSTVVTGTFDGTANGNLVTGLSNISVLVNGVGFAANGTLISGAFDRDTYSWPTAAVVSFNGLESNFGFVDGDFNNANADVFLIVPYNTTSTDLAFLSSAVGNAGEEAPAVNLQATWHLEAVPLTSTVPEPGTYGMLLAGLGLMGAVARRRLRS